MENNFTYWITRNNKFCFKTVLAVLVSVITSLQMPAFAGYKAITSLRPEVKPAYGASFAFNAAPVFVTKQYTFPRSEQLTPGSSIGTVNATDPDGEALAYTMTAGNTNSTFALDASTGKITLVKRLNQHTQDSYTLKVKATDAAGLSDETTVMVTVTKEPETAQISYINWSSVASQPYVFYEGQGKVVNGKWYTFSGFDSRKPGFTPTSRSYVYDPVVNTWTPIAPMPPMNGTNYGGVTHAGFTTDYIDIYFAGGYTANATGKGQILGTKEVWKYIVAENRYVRLPDLPRVSAAGQLEYLKGKLHYIAGTDRKAKIDLGDHYVLDLDNQAAGWKMLAPLPSPRQHAGSAVYQGKIYFIGGQTGHDEGSVAFKLVHVYNPETNSWSRLADIPAPEGTPGIAHISSSVVVKGNQIIVIGGEYEFQKGTRLVSAYSPATNTWSSLSTLPKIMRGGVGAVLGDKLYYTGGKNVKETYSGVTLTNQKVTRLTLVNADNGEDIRLIGKGATLNLANLPTKNVNIRANTSPDSVGSLVFHLNGPQTHTQTESKMPYALFGEAGDKFAAWTPQVGEYTLAVTPYADQGGKGMPGRTLQINFTVVDSPLVANLTSNTGRLYALNKLVPGVPVYTDRQYKATSVPDFLMNATFIQTPNDDKVNAGTNVFSFNLMQNATVYVAYDPRATALPAWLSTWQKLTNEVGMDDPKGKSLQLFSKSFPAGALTFDGNLVSPASGALNNYIVIVKEGSASGTPATAASPTAEAVDNTSGAASFSLYPNPKKKGEQAFIALENYGKNEKVVVTLHDMAGHVVYTQSIFTDAQGKLGSAILLPGSINPGLYFIKVNGQSCNHQAKLLIE